MATGLGTPIASGASGLVAQLCAAATGFVTGATGSTNAPAVPFVTALSASDALPGSVETLSGGNFAAGASVVVRHGGGERRHRLGLGHAAGDRPAGNRRRRRDASGPRAARARATRADRFTYAPTAAIGAPAPGAAYTQTQVVDAQFTCAASAPGSAELRGADRVRLADRHVRGRSAPFHRHRDRLQRRAGLRDGELHGRRAAGGEHLLPGRGCDLRAGAAGRSRATPAPRQRPSRSRPAPAPVAAGTPIDTSTARRAPFTVTATDANGVSRAGHRHLRRRRRAPTLDQRARRARGAGSSTPRTESAPAGRHLVRLHAGPARDRDAALHAAGRRAPRRRGCRAGRAPRQAVHGAHRRGQPVRRPSARARMRCASRARRAPGASRPASTSVTIIASGPGGSVPGPDAALHGRAVLAARGSRAALRRRHRRHGDVRRGLAVAVVGRLLDGVLRVGDRPAEARAAGP